VALLPYALARIANQITKAFQGEAPMPIRDTAGNAPAHAGVADRRSPDAQSASAGTKIATFRLEVLHGAMHGE